MDGVNDITMQMMLNISQNLMGLDITMEQLDELRNKSRAISSQITGYFKNLSVKVTMYLSRMSASLLKFENTLMSVSNKAKTSFLLVVVTTGLLSKKLLMLGGDAEEMEDKFSVVFGEMTKKANEWAENYSRAVGLSSYAIKTNLADMQNLFVGFGLTRSGAFELSKAVTTLTNDLSSMNNIDSTDAGRLMLSALMGEVQAGKSLGAVLLESELNITALQMGLDGYNVKMNETMKILIRYQTILRQNQDALNNKQDTKNSYTNQVRELADNFKDAGSNLGKSLLPQATELAKTLNSLDFSAIFSPQNLQTIGKMSMGIIAISGALYLIPKAVSIVSASMRTLIAIFNFVFFTPVGQLMLVGATAYIVVDQMSKAFTGGSVEWKKTFGDFFLYLATLYDHVFLAINKIATLGNNLQIKDIKAQMNISEFFGRDKDSKEWKVMEGQLAVLNERKAELDSIGNGIQSKIESIINQDSEGVMDSMGGSIKDTLIEYAKKFGGELKDGLIAVGGSMTDLLPQFIEMLPKKLQEEISKVDRGDISKLLDEIMNNTNGGTSKDFSIKDLGIEDQISRLKEQGIALGESGVEIIKGQISLYEGLIKELFSNEVVDTSKVEEYKNELENLNETLSETENIQEFKNKMTNLFSDIDLDNTQQSIGDSINSVFEEAIKNGISESLSESLSVELNLKVKDLIEGVDFSNEEEVKGIIKEADSWVKSKYPTWQKLDNSVDYTSENLDSLSQIAYKLGDAFENEFLTMIGDLIGVVQQINTLMSSGSSGSSVTGNAGGLISAGSSLATQGSALATGLGWASVGVAVIGAFDSYRSSQKAKEDEANEKEMQKYLDQNNLLEKGNQLLEKINDNVGTIYSNLVSNLSKNPTLGNISDGESIFDNLSNAIRDGFDVGNLSYVEYWKKSGGFWGGGSRKKKTKTLEDDSLYSLLGLDFEGAIEQLSLDDLKKVSDGLSGVTNGLIESLVTGKGGNSSSIDKVVDIFMDGVTGGGYSLLGFGGSYKFKEIEKNNSQILKEQLDNYIGTLENLIEIQGELFRDSTLEAFEGVSISDKAQLTEDFESFYDDLGLDPKDYTEEIEEMVEANKVTINAMNDVRSGFLEEFVNGGISLAQSFYKSFNGFFSKIKNNIAQVLYDVTFSDITSVADDYFRIFSDGLVNIKKTGGDLKQYVTDFLGGEENKNLMEELVNVGKAEETFDDTLDLFEKMLKDSGLSDIELIPILHPEVIDELKTSLSGAMSSAIEDQDFNSFNISLGESIYGSVKNALIQAFVDSAVYQGLLEKFFDFSNVEESIKNSSSFEEAFSIINEKMKDVERELQGAGLDFNSDSGSSSSSSDSSSSDSSSLGFTDYGEGNITKNYKIEIKGNTIYGDSEHLRDLAIKLRDEIDKIEETER